MAATPDDPAQDLALVRDALAKHEAAMLRLGERLGCVPRILGGLNARLGRPLTPHDLADVAQTTVLALIHKLAEFRGEVAFEGWVFRFCRFELMNAIRRQRRLPRRDGFDGDERPDEGALRELQQLTEREALEAAIDRIGGVEAQTVRLKSFEGLTFAEIAERCQMSVTSVKSRYYRGLSRLEAIVIEQQRKEDERGQAI